MIKGNVDLLTHTSATGWCFDHNHLTERLQVRAMLHDSVIGKTVANIPRPDLLQFGGSGDFSFYMEFPFTPPLREVEIIATCGNEIQCLSVSNTVLEKRGYQSFADQKGDSNSYHKLACLQLPEKMINASVLDIGCNEGFFCMDAIKRGATRVVGLDIQPNIIELARSRDQRTEYICSSWWNLPDEQFDYIYFLSAIHYEPKPVKLLKAIMDHLTPSGKLILEMGIADAAYQTGWRSVPRHDGVFRYPTYKMLETVLKDYSMRYVGSSTMQAGDTVRRHVFHICHRQKTAILIRGHGHSGKTCAAIHFSQSPDTVHFPVDGWMKDIIDSTFPLPGDNPVYSHIQENCGICEIDKYMDSFPASLAEAFVDALVEALPLEADYVIIEGYQLNHPAIFPLLEQKLKAMDFRVWAMGRN